MEKQGEYTAKEREEAWEDFNIFLFNMDDILEAFIEQAEGYGYRLDYSLNSLDQLETYAIKMDAKPLSDFHGHASQYLGETVRKCFGGHWNLSLNMKENSLNYGKPVIIEHTKYDVEFPPYQIFRNFLIRPIHGVLKRAVLNDVSPMLLDLSHLPTEEEPTED